MNLNNKLKNKTRNKSHSILRNCSHTSLWSQKYPVSFFSISWEYSFLSFLFFLFFLCKQVNSELICALNGSHVHEKWNKFTCYFILCGTILYLYSKGKILFPFLFRCKQTKKENIFFQCCAYIHENVMCSEFQYTIIIGISICRYSRYSHSSRGRFGALYFRFWTRTK